MDADRVARGEEREAIAFARAAAQRAHVHAQRLRAVCECRSRATHADHAERAAGQLDAERLADDAIAQHAGGDGCAPCE
jgi:hypothetical protein